MPVHLYERIFVWLSVFTLGVFLVAIFVGALGAGADVPRPVERVDPATLAEHELFGQPGVYELAPGRYRAVMVGQVWAFDPAVIEVPAGSTVTFLATTRDVIHGLKVVGTNINMMLIPGQVGEVTHTFDEPGEHLVVCHEYCGVGHQAMFGKIVVTPPLRGDIAGGERQEDL